MATRGPKNGRRGLKRGPILIIGPFINLNSVSFLVDHSLYEILKTPKLPPGGPKMADEVWKEGYSKVFRCYFLAVLLEKVMTEKKKSGKEW